MLRFCIAHSWPNTVYLADSEDEQTECNMEKIATVEEVEKTEIEFSIQMTSSFTNGSNIGPVLLL